MNFKKTKWKEEYFPAKSSQSGGKLQGVCLQGGVTSKIITSNA